MGRGQTAGSRRRASKDVAKENSAPPLRTPDACAPRGKAAITTALRRGARQRRSGVLHGEQGEGLLPPELLQLVGGALEPPDLAAASLVCRLWSRSLRGAVTSLTTHLLPNAGPNADKARALAVVLPHLGSLHLHFGTRCSSPAVAAFFRGIRGMAHLRDLRITSWVPYAPQKGAWPDGCFASLQLGGVTRLVVDGAPLSDGEALALVNGAASGNALASLTLSHGSWPHFTQLDPFQAPQWLQPAQAGASFTGVPKAQAGPVAALISRKLPSLQHLAFACDATGQCEFFLNLARVTGLTRLDLLAGAPALSSLKALRELRLQLALANTPEALEEYDLLGLTQLRRLGVRLSRRPAELLCRDLAALTRRRAPAVLVELELSRCVWSAEAVACVAALTALTRLSLERPECVRPARASASASRAAMSVDLQPLVALRGMRCFELVAATGSVAGIVQGLGKLWAAWAPTLEDVRLVDLSAAEVDPCATLPGLRACGALTSLRLLLREPMSPEVAVIDVGALPPRLEELALRHVVVTASRASDCRLARLERLSLRQCTAVPPQEGADVTSSLLQAPTDLYWHAPLLQALPALRSVELVAMPFLRDHDFAAIGRLTALTSLLICASGTIEVTHAALQMIRGLSRLRQLRWHVGDVTDLLPDVQAVKSLTSLVSLHLPSYLHGQFARWSAYFALPPLCDVHVEMPLP